MGNFADVGFVREGAQVTEKPRPNVSLVWACLWSLCGVYSGLLFEKFSINLGMEGAARAGPGSDMCRSVQVLPKSTKKSPQKAPRNLPKSPESLPNLPKRAPRDLRGSQKESLETPEALQITPVAAQALQNRHMDHPGTLKVVPELPKTCDLCHLRH